MDQILDLPTAQSSTLNLMNGCSESLVAITTRPPEGEVASGSGSSRMDFPFSCASISRAERDVLLDPASDKICSLQNEEYYSSHLPKKMDEDGEQSQAKRLKADAKQKHIQNLLQCDIKCSVCLRLFVKPVTLVCGHTFCRLCIMKYFLNNSRSCPLCRKQLTQSIEEYQINRVLDELCRRASPLKYMNILSQHSTEENKRKLMPRLLAKYSDKERVPTAYERFVWLLNFLFPYFKTMKLVLTIFTPILILIWYAKNFNRVSQATSEQPRLGLLKEFYLANNIDLNYYETLLLRLSQLLFSVLGF